MAQLAAETAEKVAAGQARVVFWDDIKHNPPRQLKVSPLAMVPHKSRKWRTILDMSFRLRLSPGELVPSVNKNTSRTAPRGSIEPDEKVFAAKFDIKDGFLRLDCEEGEEWNFAFVLPRRPGVCRGPHWRACGPQVPRAHSGVS